MTDRAREALFSSLGDAVVDARVLDLYAGSGSLGLEALSRGAASVVFVEHGREAVSTLRANIETVGLGGDVVSGKVERFLASASGHFDLVFLDPPYVLDTAVVVQQLEQLIPLMSSRATIVLHRRKGDPDPPVPTNLFVTDDRTYGGTHLIRYQRNET